MYYLDSECLQTYVPFNLGLQKMKTFVTVMVLFFVL